MVQYGTLMGGAPMIQMNKYAKYGNKSASVNKSASGNKYASKLAPKTFCWYDYNYGDDSPYYRSQYNSGDHYNWP